MDFFTHVYCENIVSLLVQYWICLIIGFLGGCAWVGIHQQNIKYNDLIDDVRCNKCEDHHE